MLDAVARGVGKTASVSALTALCLALAAGIVARWNERPSDPVAVLVICQCAGAEAILPEAPPAAAYPPTCQLGMLLVVVGFSAGCITLGFALIGCYTCGCTKDRSSQPRGANP